MPDKYDKYPIPEPFLTTKSVARYCHMSDTQVKRWIQNGELKAIQTPGGHYRISKNDFKDFLNRYNMPIVDKFFEGVKKKKVLIADDDTVLANLMKDALEDFITDIEIEIAHDGYDALIKTGKFSPDVLILDIRMPKIDGLEVCRRLRQDTSLSQGMKIIAVTAHSDKYDKKTVLASGADEYLVKPIEIHTLQTHVEKLI